MAEEPKSASSESAEVSSKAEAEVSTPDTDRAPSESAEVSSKAEAEVSRPGADRKQSKLLERPFRVKLRGSVLALLRLPNRRDVRSAIHQLSITGGVVHLEKPLDENLTVEMIFHMGGTTIRAKAQLLFPMWATQGWMQPFRFLELSDESREKLSAGLTSLVGDKTSTATAGA
jgi:hypothetical protein